MSEMEESILSTLPPDIQIIIKRKSSRDPVTRFSNKLHILLNYAGDDVIKQENIGCGWVSDSRFRLNKKRLISAMDIKLNTLNVNLKDLKFQPIQGDQNGWTLWERPGFHRNSTIDDISDVKCDKSHDKDSSKPILSAADSETQLTRLNSLRDLVIGDCDINASQQFRRIVISIWDEILEGINNQANDDPREFLKAIAERFREHKQSLKNAIAVLQAIFICSDPQHVSILDFAKFLAKFGPEETLMLKVGSLIKASNQYGKWLYLPGETFPLDANTFYGEFDELEHNSIILHVPGQKDIKIRNLINVPAGDQYLVDSSGNNYDSWLQFFERNPIHSMKMDFTQTIQNDSSGFFVL